MVSLNYIVNFLVGALIRRRLGMSHHKYGTCVKIKFCCESHTLSSAHSHVLAKNISQINSFAK